MQKSISNSSFGSAWKEKLEPATINELLLRGCTIRNSQWIIGLVVFTGSDTKIMLNGGETPVSRQYEHEWCEASKERRIAHPVLRGLRSLSRNGARLRSRPTSTSS